MEQITKILYWISTGLMVPVVVLLLIFFIRALMLIGSFYSTYVGQLKFNKQMAPVWERLTAENVLHELQHSLLQPRSQLSVFLRKASETTASEIHYNKLLNDFEIVCQKEIAGSQTLAKIGPILGLMGTLIPMGPALVGLASGDISSMASNMQVAFATTVIGLLVGAVGFIILQVKKRWMAADINTLEFVVELLEKSPKNIVE